MLGEEEGGKWILQGGGGSGYSLSMGGVDTLDDACCPVYTEVGMDFHESTINSHDVIPYLIVCFLEVNSNRLYTASSHQ